MVILLILCVIPITLLGVYLFITNNKNGIFFTYNPSIPIVASIIALLPLLFACLFTIINIQQTYNGFCESPPDISQACSYTEYIIFNISPNAGWNTFGYFILGSIEIAWASAVFGLTAFYVKNIK